MERSYWLGNTKTAWTGKVAVSPTGHAIQKNYKRLDLRDGDIGLTVRIDRERVNQMTPEQRLAAQAIAEEMMRDYLAALGKETVEGTGIPVGTAVRIGKDEKTAISTIAPYLDYFTKRAVVGVLERETRIGLHLSCVSDDGAKKTRLFMPFAEARDVGGIVILDVPIERTIAERYLYANTKHPHPGARLWLKNGFDFDNGNLQRFFETWNASGMFELLRLISSRVVWYRGINSWEQPNEVEIKKEQDKEDALVIEFLLPFLQKLDTQHLELLGREAAFPGVRIAATELFREHLISDAVKS